MIRTVRGNYSSSCLIYQKERVMNVLFKFVVVKLSAFIHLLILLTLGEDSKTLMLVHVSPKEEDLCETICSLNFAARVKSVHLGNDETNVSFSMLI